MPQVDSTIHLARDKVLKDSQYTGGPAGESKLNMKKSKGGLGSLMKEFLKSIKSTLTLEMKGERNYKVKVVYKLMERI